MTTPSVPSGENSSKSTSDSLLELARNNNAEAWERIVYLYSPLVYSWSRRYGLQEADTLDVAQNVFQSVYANLQRFRKDRPEDSFRAWLKTITHNKTVDFFRDQARTQRGQGGSDGPDGIGERPIPDLEDPPSEQISERKLLLRRAVEMVRVDFEPQTWDAFWKVVIDEVAPTEVATTLGISVNAVYLAKSRVLNRLKLQFAQLLEDD